MVRKRRQKLDYSVPGKTVLTFSRKFIRPTKKTLKKSKPIFVFFKVFDLFNFEFDSSFTTLDKKVLNGMKTPLLRQS